MYIYRNISDVITVSRIGLTPILEKGLRFQDCSSPRKTIFQKRKKNLDER